MTPALGVVIVTHRSADDLPRTLGRLGEQLRPGDELVIVDSASDDGTPEVARALAPHATVVASPENLGFAAGCHAGVARLSTPLVLLLNPDAEVRPGCLDALRAAAAAHPRWGAWQALVLLADGTSVNSAGGVTHFLGFGWAGGCERPLAEVDVAPRTSFPSGAALVVRREAWDRLGGFDPAYFMYGEDLDLGLRLWLAGWEVGVVADAQVRHDYAFAKGPSKWFLLERNRWRTVVGTYPAPLLLALLPALLAFELALLPVAAAGGWLGPKLRAQAAVVAELPALLARRRAVQAQRTVGTAAFAAQLTDALDSPFLAPARRLGPLVRLQAAYWRLVRRLLGA